MPFSILFPNCVETVRKCWSVGLLRSRLQSSETWFILHGQVYKCVLLGTLITIELFCNPRAVQRSRGLMKEIRSHPIPNIFGLNPNNFYIIPK